MRDMTPAVAAEIEKIVTYPVILAELDFLSGPVRIWSGIGQLQYSGVEWTGLGDLLSISEIEETNDGKATEITATLTGIPSYIATSVYTEEWKRRDAKAWLGFASGTEIIDEPVPMFYGLMDVISDEDDGETSIIQLTIATHALDQGNNRVWRLTHELQQQFWPGDDGLKYTTALQQANLRWGDKKNPSRPIKSITGIL